MKRRELLKNLGLGVGAITLTPAVSSLLHSCSDGTSWKPVFFSKDQIILLSNLKTSPQPLKTRRGLFCLEDYVF